MLRSMKTLVGALCLFASAFSLSAHADEVPSSGLKAFISGKFGTDAADKTPGAKKSRNAYERGKSAARTKNYARLIRKAAKKHGVPERVALAVVQVESNFNPRARGRAGEIGLMQIKPATARGLGFRGASKALYDPQTNLEWGMRYLAGAHKRASGDLCGTILRYNAGHFAKRMNPVSSRYCRKIKAILAST
ncbi:transglycosylase SLT domain-containing protein [uncultured Roseibium sp.]|uniref:lytic transglycosylase domain-containing protein n=1 Tax=uncultured Roseibium sp. TaxID=1936171 RepID=UPI003216439C